MLLSCLKASSESQSSSGHLKAPGKVAEADRPAPNSDANGLVSLPSPRPVLFFEAFLDLAEEFEKVIRLQERPCGRGPRLKKKPLRGLHQADRAAAPAAPAQPTSAPASAKASQAPNGKP